MDGTFSEHCPLAGSAGGEVESLHCCQSYMFVIGIMRGIASRVLRHVAPCGKKKLADVSEEIN